MAECFIDFINDHLALIGAIVAAGVCIALVRKWMNGGWCYSKVQLDGKTVIVTGANTGIGKETARDFVRRGARVILACRNMEKGCRAVREIESAGRGNVALRQLDLSSFRSIRKFCKDIMDTEKQVNVLVNNAGLVCPKNKTEDGFDMIFGTNHLGPFLLTNLLLPKIKESRPARIINLSSMGHVWATMNWDDLNMDTNPEKYSPFRAYIQSKLANILFTKELAERLQGTGVNAYAVHPGAVRTEIARNAPWFRLALYSVFSPLLMKNPVQGAQTTIYCAVSEEVSHQSGLYYSDCAVKTPGKHALKRGDANRLWDISMEMVGLQCRSEVSGGSGSGSEMSSC